MRASEYAPEKSGLLKRDIKMKCRGCDCVWEQPDWYSNWRCPRCGRDCKKEIPTTMFGD
jgi:PHP family Zn ribbon phosphoesterase